METNFVAQFLCKKKFRLTLGEVRPADAPVERDAWRNIAV